MSVWSALLNCMGGWVSGLTGYVVCAEEVGEGLPPALLVDGVAETWRGGWVGGWVGKDVYGRKGWSIGGWVGGWVSS